MLKVFIKGILAGFAISIGGWLYLSCNQVTSTMVIGAFLFSIGLMLICSFDFHLYTGRICYIVNKNEESTKTRILKLFLALIGNLVGTIVFGTVLNLMFKDAKPALFNALDNMVNTKLDYPWYKMLILSIFCGIMVFLAVDGFKKIEGFSKYLVLALCIGGFIIMGFEHSIANMFYFFCNMTYSLKAVLYIIICIIGNSIGGVLFPLLYKVAKSE